MRPGEPFNLLRLRCASGDLPVVVVANLSAQPYQSRNTESAPSPCQGSSAVLIRSRSTWPILYQVDFPAYLPPSSIVYVCDLRAKYAIAKWGML